MWESYEPLAVANWSNLTVWAASTVANASSVVFNEPLNVEKSVVEVIVTWDEPETTPLVESTFPRNEPVNEPDNDVDGSAIEEPLESVATVCNLPSVTFKIIIFPLTASDTLTSLVTTGARLPEASFNVNAPAVLIPIEPPGILIVLLLK